MILLKKPYKPVMFPGVSATFNVYGRSFYKLDAVYLSGAPLSQTTFHNPFSAIPSLSAKYPGFNAYRLPTTAYTSNNDNTITINIPAPVRLGYIDVIAQNRAGYGALTQYVIKEVSTGLPDLITQRPWAYGVQVLSGVGIQTTPDNQIFAINGDILVTIAGDNIVGI